VANKERQARMSRNNGVKIQHFLAFLERKLEESDESAAVQKRRLIAKIEQDSRDEALSLAQKLTAAKLAKCTVAGSVESNILILESLLDEEAAAAATREADAAEDAGVFKKIRNDLHRYPNTSPWYSPPYEAISASAAALSNPPPNSEQGTRRIAPSERRSQYGMLPMSARKAPR
jgi:hypothetical protein